MAAGTGGHIMPGLAVAREMQARGWRVSWLGTSHGMENRLVPPSGLPMDTIAFAGLRGKGAFGAVRGGVQLLKALVACRGILKRRQADAVLGMGGYVCFPGGLVAHWLKRPLVLVNADAGLLLSNRSLLKFTDRVAFGFDGEAARSVPQGVVTGNPGARRDRGHRATCPAFRQPHRPAARARRRWQPGRTGAQRDRATRAGPAVGGPSVPSSPTRPGWRTTRRFAPPMRRPGLLDLEHGSTGVEVVPFIDDMARRLADCDLIVCRAGAVTVSELCAAGVPSVLVPLVVSTTAHQRDNAQWMAQHDAGLHLPQTELTPVAAGRPAAPPRPAPPAADGGAGARAGAAARRAACGRRNRTTHEPRISQMNPA